MTKRLMIIGAGGHGKVVADIAMKMSLWSDIAFLDDNATVKSNSGFPILGRIAQALDFKDNTDFFIAIGNNAMRRKLQEWLESHRCSFVNLIHPTAVIAPDVEIGLGTSIMANVVINSATVIKKGCIINTSSSIEHDNTVGEFVHVSPGVRTAGGVVLGDDVWLGIGSIVSNNVKICNYTIVGAGAVVIHDLVESGKYVGNPVRKLD
jgi:sugar O-acyltransferase (sialic acid O-acetyltransferase NeuD family)